MNSNAADLKSDTEDLQNAVGGSQRKFWIAMLLYGALAILAWYTIGAGSVDVNGKQVQVRLVPLVVFGVLALRTVLGRHADRIRREDQEGHERDPEV